MLASLGDRMKSYETRSSSPFLESLPFIIRLDGHRFSKFSKPFDKPFDQRSKLLSKTTPFSFLHIVHKAMLLTARDLLNEYNPTSVFTESDEISMIFPEVPEDSTSQRIFGGKISKIISLSAGFCSARFNYHLTHQVQPDASPKVQ